MKKIITGLVCYILILNLLSCDEIEEKKNGVGDVSFLLHTYNTQLWGEYLPARQSKDSILTESLNEIAFVITTLARDIGTKSGGLNKDGTLFKPIDQVPLSEDELDVFYSTLKRKIEFIDQLEGREKVKQELNRVIGFLFFNEEGELPKNKLKTMTVVEAVSKLFIFENVCYYLIVKYS